MSSYTYVDVVPFVVHNVLNDDNYPPKKLTDLHRMSFPEDVEETTGEEVPKEFKGWHMGPGENIGKKRNILLDRSWIKGSYRVFLLNESQYSSVGSLELAVISDSAKAVKAFLKDFEYCLDDKVSSYTIEKTAAVQWTC